MKIAKQYSHLNGEEWLLVHEPALYGEIRQVIQAVDAEACRTKVSRERGRKGDRLFSPVNLNASFQEHFSRFGWHSTRYTYYIAHNSEQFDAMLSMSLEEQRNYLIEQGYEAIRSYNQTDHVKDKVAVEVQFGKYAFVAYDLFVKHLAFYAGRVIEVGVEILPTRAMQQEMSSGIAYFEGELHNILRHGRTSPPVPLLLLGVEP